MPTLRQLEYLVTVADTGSFTHAAELLAVTQPALSHQVQALERTLGGPVFERLPRRVRLTPLGRAVLPHARSALAEAERIRSVARRAAGLEEGELEVAAVYSVTLGILPPVLREWRRRHPGVRIRLREFAHDDDLRAAMAAGRADLAVGPEPVDWDGPVHPLGVEEFVVVTAADDPLAAADRIPLTALAAREWVHYAPANGLSDVLDRACAAAGFTPRAAIRAEQTSAALLLAAAGLGPTLVPADVVPPAFDGIARPVEPPLRRVLAAYARTGSDPVAAAFIEVAREQVRLAG